MKRLFTILIFCLLPLSAYAWGVVGMSGGVAEEGGEGGTTCDTDTDSQLFAFGSENLVSNYGVTTTNWQAMVFVSPSGTDWTLTEYDLYIYDDGNGTATFTASLYTTNASHQPLAEVEGTTATCTGVPASFGNHTLTLGTPKTGLSCGTEYAVVLRASTANGAWRRSAEDSGVTNGRICSSTDSGSTWGTPSAVHAFGGNGVYGCVTP